MANQKDVKLFEMRERLFSLVCQLQGLSFVASTMTEPKECSGASALIFNCIDKMTQEVDTLTALCEELS